jgi:hypothetical protein
MYRQVNKQKEKQMYHMNHRSIRALYTPFVRGVACWMLLSHRSHRSHRSHTLFGVRESVVHRQTVALFTSRMAVLGRHANTVFASALRRGGWWVV